MARVAYLDRRTATGIASFNRIAIDSPDWFAWIATQQELFLVEEGIYDEERLGRLMRLDGPAGLWLLMRSGYHGRVRAVLMGPTARLTTRRMLAAIEHLSALKLKRDRVLTRQW